MTSFLGIPLLALWIMGAPLIGALISLAMPAPRLNTMPRQRRRDEHFAETHGGRPQLGAAPVEGAAAPYSRG